MAVVKAAKGGKTLSQAINYAARDGTVRGKDCPDDPQQARSQMQITKELWDKTEGRQYKHYIQSFDQGEVTKEQANEIGFKWAEKNFPDYEVVVGTHADKEHIHNHFIVNSVNFEDGKKIHLDKEDLERFKTVSDDLCKEYGLSIIDRTKEPARGEIRAYNMEKYKTLERAAKGEIKSHVLDTATALDKALETAANKKEFIQQMEGQGYKVDWEDSKKNITFTGPDDKRVRASNLEKTFTTPKFGKEGIVLELQRNQERRHEQGRGTATVNESGISESSSRYGSQNRGRENETGGGIRERTASSGELFERIKSIRETTGHGGKGNERTARAKSRIRSQSEEIER